MRDQETVAYQVAAAAQEPLTLGFASAFSKTHWLWTQGGAVFAKAVEDVFDEARLLDAAARIRRVLGGG